MAKTCFDESQRCIFLDSRANGSCRSVLMHCSEACDFRYLSPSSAALDNSLVGPDSGTNQYRWTARRDERLDLRWVQRTRRISAPSAPEGG